MLCCIFLGLSFFFVIHAVLRNSLSAHWSQLQNSLHRPLPATILRVWLWENASPAFCKLVSLNSPHSNSSSTVIIILESHTDHPLAQRDGSVYKKMHPLIIENNWLPCFLWNETIMNYLLFWWLNLFHNVTSWTDGHIMLTVCNWSICGKNVLYFHAYSLAFTCPPSSFIRGCNSLKRSYPWWKKVRWAYMKDSICKEASWLFSMI